MTTKHTPGPWAFAAYTKRRFGLGQAGDCALYMIQCEYGDTTIDICRNDVRLMSAAPEMLIALEHCLNWLPEDCAAACEARAVISKATGATNDH